MSLFLIKKEALKSLFLNSINTYKTSYQNEMFARWFYF